MRLFNLDGPFHKYGTMLFDLIMLNVLWFLLTFFSLGILIGPATKALYAAVHICIVKSEGYPLKTFFQKFKEGFKVSFLTSLIALFVILMSSFSIYLILSGYLVEWLIPIYIALIIYVLFITPYVLGILAQKKTKVLTVIKFGFFLAVKHFPWTFLCFIIMLALALLVYLTTFTGLLYLVSPATALISIIISNKILVRYNFSDDNDKEEEETVIEEA